MSVPIPNTSPLVSGPTGVDAKAAQHRKLVDAAQQFEGMLLEQILKPLESKHGGFSGVEDSDSDGEDTDTLQSFGTEAVAQAVARSGGLGIARQIVQKVEHQTDSPKV